MFMIKGYSIKFGDVQGQSETHREVKSTIKFIQEQSGIVRDHRGISEENQGHSSTVRDTHSRIHFFGFRKKIINVQLHKKNKNLDDV
jgi:hypothetical protein